MSQATEFAGHSNRRARAGWAMLRWKARRALGWPGRMYRARQLMHQLDGLGDHELRDIGLTRLDLQAASALPLDADPSSLLRRRSEERRRGG